jgi:hypothetical protein
MNAPLPSLQEGKPLSRFLSRLALTSLLLLILVALAVAGARDRPFSQPLQPSIVVPASAATPDLEAPLLSPASLTLQSATAAWQVAWRPSPDAIAAQVAWRPSPDAIAATLSRRYPRIQERFPDGIQLTLLDHAHAPQPLRGPYDDQPAELSIGAIYPEALPGQSVQPQAEAWAGCRRDLELGPARQLDCYLFVQGEPGDTLDGLAILAWIQALDEIYTGQVQPLDRSQLPFLNATQEGEQWTYADSYLSISPSDSRASSS